MTENLEHPQLVVLDVLDAVAGAAVRALLAAHPELREPATVDEIDEPRLRQAESLYFLLTHLQSGVEVYRRALGEVEDQREDALPF